jgi:hypothetical protein
MVGKSIISNNMAAAVVYQGVFADFTEITPEEIELECECCIKLKLELSETVSEVKSAIEIIRIPKENLDMANSSKHETSIPSNFKRQKGQTKSCDWNKVTARHPARNRGEMGILQKAL